MPRSETEVSALHRTIVAALGPSGRGARERKAQGAVYTPSTLADLVVGRALAARDRAGQAPVEIVLDPACGAGHFLVSAWAALRHRKAPIALYGMDIDAGALAAARRVLASCRRLDRLELGASALRFRGVATDSLRADPLGLAGRADLVIGNPPYVRIDRLPAGARADLSARYSDWIAGKWDLYQCFLARALEWLAPGGILGFVTPNQYLLGRSASRLRAGLARRSEIVEILDLCGLEPFDDAIPPAAVTILRRCEPAPDHRVRIQVCLGSAAARDTLSGEVRQERWRDGTWSVMAPEPFRAWLDRLDAPPLGDLCSAIREGDTRRTEEALVRPASAAPDYWWPAVRGRDIAPLRLNLARHGDRLPPAPPEVARRRVLIRDVACRLVAAPDPGRVRCLRTVYCAYPSEATSPERLAALLNTDLLTWLYVRLYYSSKMSPRAANFRFQSQFLARLPVLIPPDGLQPGGLESWALEAYGVPAAERAGIRPLLERLRACNR